MNDLKISDSGGGNSVASLLEIDTDPDFPIDGRDLHKALEVDTEYRHWFPRMCEYGFQEGKDFHSEKLEGTGGRPRIDHKLTFDMAKHISMAQRTESAMKIRQYLIDVEKDLKSPEQIMSRALKIADKTIDSYYSSLSEKASKSGVLDLFTVLKIIPKEYASQYKNPCDTHDVSNNEQAKLTMELYRDFQDFSQKNSKFPQRDGYGYIYAIEFGKYIKIGCTVQPVRRIKEIKANAEHYGRTTIGRITISGFHSNYRSTERTLHEFFSGKRLKGSELFDIPLDDVIQYIENQNAETKLYVTVA